MYCHKTKEAGLSSPLFGTRMKQRVAANTPQPFFSGKLRNYLPFGVI
jgi:hypothetical protein